MPRGSASSTLRTYGAIRVIRDIGAVYLAVVLLVSILEELATVLSPAGLAAALTLLVYAGRVATNRLYVGSHLGTSVLMAGGLSAGLLYVLTIRDVDEAHAGLITVAALVIFYAWGVFFYRRRTLRSDDLDWIERLLRARLDEEGDSTMLGQELRDLIARVREQKRIWSSW